MSAAPAWAEAIGAASDAEGLIVQSALLAHVRGAIIEAGFVSRGRITGGMKEAYRPLGIDEDKLRRSIDETLGALVKCGDIDEFSTAAGRGYAPTTPRRVDWGGAEATLLGGVGAADAGAPVRRVPAGQPVAGFIAIPLSVELGRPAWRSILVELGGSDAPDGSAAALFESAATLASGGERFALDDPGAVAVLSGRGPFFGKSDDPPSGRWRRVDGDGCFPAVVKVGYTSRNIMLSVSGGGARSWQPPSRDAWRWMVAGATLAAGDPVLAYEPGSRRLDFLTPPSRQAERAALLSGVQIGAWSWTVEASAYETIRDLIGPVRRDGGG